MITSALSSRLTGLRHWTTPTPSTHAHAHAGLRRIQRATPIKALDGGSDDDSLSETMKADMQRFAQKKQQSEPSSTTARSNSSSEDSSSSSSIKDNLDKFLIGDFFFVCFSLAWLGAGVVLQGSGSSALLDAWFPLWPLVWQPAIGILMAGALLNGAWGWLADKTRQN